MNKGGPGAWALSQLSSVASFLCTTSHPAPVSLSSPALFHPWHRAALAASSALQWEQSQLRAVCQYSIACTTCIFCWNLNSSAPVCCLQKKRMLSLDSVQLKITGMLLPLFLSKLFLFLLTGNTLPNNISFTSPLRCSLCYASHAATDPAIMNSACVWKQSHPPEDI